LAPRWRVSPGAARSVARETAHRRWDDGSSPPPTAAAPDRSGEDRLGVEGFGHRLEFVERQFAALTDRRYDTYPLLFAERDAHATARFDRHAVRQQIVKSAGQRNGQGNVSDGHLIFLT
jgi:hypothetical protein